MSTYRVYPPCPEVVSQEFGTTPLDENGQLVYSNPWRMHLGIDLAVPEGTAIRAARTGRVLWSGNWDAFGLCVVLGHADGSRTVYCHLSRLFAVVGQRVRGGRKIGLSGNTGWSEGPHCHLECWIEGISLRGSPYDLTRQDPTALPADPAILWRGGWPTVGMHTPGFDIPIR